MRTLRSSALALCALLSLAPPASAQKGKPSEAEKKQLEDARAAFEEAEAFYKILKFEEALAAYQRAYLSSQAPELLFNLGQCYRQLGRKEEAIRLYQNFLRELPAHPKRPEVERMIASLQEASAAPVLPSPSSQALEPPGPEAAPSSQAASLPASVPGVHASLQDAAPVPAPARAPRALPLFVASGAALGLGAAFGLSSVAGWRRVAVLQRPGAEDSILPLQRAARLDGLLADACFVGAAGLAVAGVLRARRAVESPVSLSFQPSPRGLALVGGF